MQNLDAPPAVPSDSAGKDGIMPLLLDAALLDAIAAASGDYLNVYDREGRWLYVSQAAADALGMRREAMLGKTPLEIGAPPDVAARLRRDIATVWATRQPARGNTPYLVHGQQRELEYNLSALSGQDGSVQFVLCVVKDVTARKQAEAELLQSKDNLDFALSGAQIGTFYCDLPFDKIIWNDTCKEHFFLPHDASVDFNLFYSLLHPDDREPTRRAIDHCMSERVQYNVEYRVVAPDGRMRWINAIGRGFYDEKGDPCRFDGITLDISERKLAEEEQKRAEADLRRQQAEIQAMNERLQRAMQETHHRVKNSLQLVSALIDMQVGDYEDAVPTANVRHVNTQVRALAAVHDTLTEEAKGDQDAQIVSVRTLLEKLLPLVSRIAGNRRLKFTLDDLRVPAKIGTSIALITNELVLNALKHGKGEVEITFAVAQEQATLEVCDDGEGLPDGFDPMQAANTGLELVTSLARWDLGGAVSYSNHPDHGGARITVSIPIAHNIS